VRVTRWRAKEQPDRWLDEQTSFASGQKVSNYVKWFHVIGHEINHRGQIRWLQRRLAALELL
jgi:uncharacterized damage-inducible protein DinB